MGGLSTLGPDGAVLSLLVCGHVLSDFVFQSAEVAHRKRERLGVLVRHAALVTGIQAAALVPVLGTAGLAIVVGIGASHLLVDLLKILLEKGGDPRLRHFVLDQILHLAVLLLAWRVWVGASVEPFLDVGPEALAILTQAGVLVAAYGFNVHGAATLVSRVLLLCKVSMPESGGSETGAEPSRGTIIGILERLIVLTCVLAGQWGAFGLVMAAKSIARFKDLEDRSFAEYYLIGTLMSVGIAVFTGVAAAKLL